LDADLRSFEISTTCEHISQLHVAGLLINIYIDRHEKEYIEDPGQDNPCRSEMRRATRLCPVHRGRIA